MKVLIRQFEGTTPDGVWHGFTITAGTDTPSEALESAEQLGLKLLEHQIPGIEDARAVGGDWTEHEMPDEDEDE